MGTHGVYPLYTSAEGRGSSCTATSGAAGCATMPAVSESSSPTPRAFFVRDGRDLLPTVATQGPWDPGAQHGGPVCAALAYLIESVPTLVSMQVSRFTFDLFRAAPLTRLGTATRVVREGKRLQLVEAVLLDRGTEIARGAAMRLREVDLAEVLEHPQRPKTKAPAPSGNIVRPLPAVADRIGFLRAIEIDRLGGMPGSGPPSISWYRARLPLVEGEAMSPLQRLALFADFTSASALYLDHRSYSAINPDVTVQVLRRPVGEWLCVDGTTDAGGNGIGHSRSSIYDTDGFVASASTSQLIDRVRSPFA